jgi:hypothetical protein
MQKYFYYNSAHFRLMILNTVYLYESNVGVCSGKKLQGHH